MLAVVARGVAELDAVAHARHADLEAGALGDVQQLLHRQAAAVGHGDAGGDYIAFAVRHAGDDYFGFSVCYGLASF